MLVDKGASINSKTKKDFTPLHVACKFGRPEMVRFFIDKGSDVNFPAKHQLTPVHLATHNRYTHCFPYKHALLSAEPQHAYFKPVFQP